MSNSENSKANAFYGNNTNEIKTSSGTARIAKGAVEKLKSSKWVKRAAFIISIIVATNAGVAMEKNKNITPDDTGVMAAAIRSVDDELSTKVDTAKSMMDSFQEKLSKDTASYIKEADNIYNKTKEVHQNYLDAKAKFESKNGVISGLANESSVAKGYISGTQADELANLYTIGNSTDFSDNYMSYLIGNRLIGTGSSYNVKRESDKFVRTLLKLQNVERTGVRIDYGKLFDLNNSDKTLTTVISSIQDAREGYVMAYKDNNHDLMDKYAKDLNTIVERNLLGNEKQFSGVESTILSIIINGTDKYFATHQIDYKNVWKENCPSLNEWTMPVLGCTESTKDINELASNQTIADGAIIEQADGFYIVIKGNVYNISLTKLKTELTESVDKAKDMAKENSKSIAIKDLNGEEEMTDGINAFLSEKYADSLTSDEYRNVINYLADGDVYFTDNYSNNVNSNKNNEVTSSYTHVDGEVVSEKKTEKTDAEIAEELGVPVDNLDIDRENNVITELPSGDDSIKETVTDYGNNKINYDEDGNISSIITSNGDEYYVDYGENTKTETDGNTIVTTTTSVKEEEIDSELKNIGDEKIIEETTETKITYEDSNGKKYKTKEERDAAQEKIDQENLANGAEFDVVLEESDFASKLKKEMSQSQTNNADILEQTEEKAENKEDNFVTNENMDSSINLNGAIGKTETITTTTTDVEKIIENGNDVTKDVSQEIEEEVVTNYFYIDEQGERHDISAAEFEQIKESEDFVSIEDMADDEIEKFTFSDNITVTDEKTSSKSDFTSTENDNCEVYDSKEAALEAAKNFSDEQFKQMIEENKGLSKTR